MLDVTTIRAELAAHYDLTPSIELARQMSDIYARMDRVMPFPDWAMAAPYVAVALWPALANRLPRPGAWMVRLRVLLAFPMLATVLWLVWVLGVQRGLEASVALLLLLLTLSLAVWSFAQPGWGWRAPGLVGVVLTAAGALVLAGALAHDRATRAREAPAA